MLNVVVWKIREIKINLVVAKEEIGKGMSEKDEGDWERQISSCEISNGDKSTE